MSQLTSCNQGIRAIDPRNSYQWHQTTVLSPVAERLLKLQFQCRWGVVALLWICLGLPSLWLLRTELRRLLEFFTWAGLKYSLIFDPVAGFGLCTCAAVTLTTLLWHCKYELFGLSARERLALEKLAASIQKKGPTHFLWNRAMGDRQ